MLFVVTAQLECRRAPAAPSTVMPGIAQMEKGNPLPQVREMCKVSQGCRRHLAGKAQEVLVAPSAGALNGMLPLCNFSLRVLC